MLGKITHKITNTEWLCPFCNSWSNAVEWRISVNPNFKQCPKCKEIYLEYQLEEHGQS